MSRYIETLKESHWLAVKIIRRYIKGRLNLDLFYAYGKTAELVGYSDSDWEGDQDKRKTTTTMSSILDQLHFYGPQRSKELWPYFHVNIWRLHLQSVKQFG